MSETYTTVLSDEELKLLRIAKRKKLIKAYGFKYSDFGTTPTVYKVVNEMIPGKIIRKKIADALGVHEKEIW